ncbi:carbohydrate esterase family 9 protein [Lentinula aff. lateritia]|uniref:Carbohydrate esterase family 9 protein n=1 Tax=Lentinula aff. lateritia TaxID=2804960 RepID=A0ACC1TY92_9AGAR|nr:carbohydrate esterase family 9 protein [Lentinula aff. lateritia]
MDKAIIAPYSEERPSRVKSRQHPLLRAALAFSLLVACGYASLFTAYTASRGADTRVKVPINAHEIIRKCAHLNDIPGPPPNFGSRKESDRYVPETKPTWIKNATIWTGNIDGLEVILEGDLFLDKGIIKAVGKVPAQILNAYDHDYLSVIDANGSWVSPGIVDIHSHLGDYSSPKLRGSDDTNSRRGLVQPWLRSLDSLNTHDDAYHLSIAGGVTTSVILPGSANAIGGQAFVIKLRPTEERSPSSMLLEPPFTFNGSGIEEVQPPRWRQLKQACGENPSRFYSGTRMDTIWAYRQGYEEARKLKVKQDAYCEKAAAKQWDGLGDFPEDLQWEALVDVLRGKVKIQNHCYEAVDLDGIVRLTNEFKFPIAAFHHAHETYLVPELLKKAYGTVPTQYVSLTTGVYEMSGHTPAVALFATNARYKRESYRGSEFAPRILADNGIQVVMKSDHPVLNSRFLMFEAQQAHYFGLASNLALASVTSTPAQIMGQDHRIGYIRKGFDADVVLWDSHPLAVGATPKQVFIDGIAQLKKPFSSSKPDLLQRAPETPDFDEETKAALEHDGLPPLEPKESISDVVIFQNFDSLFLDMGNGVEQIFTAENYVGESQIAVVRNGKLSCIGTTDVCIASVNVDSRTVDLQGGSLAPGLISYGSPLGLVHIAGEESTQDGEVFDGLIDKLPTILGGNTAVIRAVDGLQFATRDALLAYRSGVTTGVTAPCSSGLLAGLSTAFNTGAAHKLIEGAVVQDEVALHVSLSLSSSVSVSTQIATLRRLLLGGGAKGDLEVQITKVLEGKIPLVISVHSADIMASLIQLKAEVTKETGSAIQMTFAGASEAHLLAKEISAAGVGVIFSPARSFPFFWDMRRILPGPPLTQHSAVSTLLANNVTVGVGVNFDESWAVRNTRFDVSWASLEAGGEISKAGAIALASSNLEKLLGLASGIVSSNLIATTGGTVLDFESKVIAVASAKRGVVDLF